MLSPTSLRSLVFGSAPQSEKPRRKTLTPRCILITRQCSVQISSRTNQSQVRKGLREIPKMPAVSAQFLRIESKMVRVPQQLLQQQLRFFQVAGASQAFHIP